MRLRTQKFGMGDTVRVEVAFEVETPLAGKSAVLAYDDPVAALVDACAFVETALNAVRELAVRQAAGELERDAGWLEQDWKRTMGDKP